MGESGSKLVLLPPRKRGNEPEEAFFGIGVSRKETKLV